MADKAADNSPRGRRGGGAARRAERTVRRIEAPHVLIRAIPTLDILDAEALEIIEWNAETILEEVGVVFADNPSALARWREAGADVRDAMVRIPRGLARTLSATAPARFTQVARNPERSIEISDKNTIFCNILRTDIRAQPEWRAALCDHGGLSNLREAHLPVAASAPLRRHGVRTDRRRGEQAPPRHAARPHDAVGHAVHGVGDGAGARGGQRGDGRDPVRRRIRARQRGGDLADEPQRADGFRRDDDGALEIHAAAGQAVIVSPFIGGGAMAPVSAAGVLTQLLAEVLAGAAYARLVRPGAPAIFGVFVASTDLNSGAPMSGTAGRR